MAGYREFQTGEVLTAANVNDFLMEQSVMKFADAAARDTALGTAVGGGNALREGMVAYLDSTDEVLKYDGTAWDVVAPVVAGVGTNTVFATTTTTTTTTSTSFVDTSLAATITPTSATAKVLIVVSVAQLQNPNNANDAQLRLYRGTTSGTALGSAIMAKTYSTSNTETQVNAAIVFLDSPATTSATTYTLGLKSANGGVCGVYFQQSMVLIEVAA